MMRHNQKKKILLTCHVRLMNIKIRIVFQSNCGIARNFNCDQMYGSDVLKIKRIDKIEQIK